MPEDVNTGTSSTPAEIDTASDAALASRDFERYTEIENAREQNKAIPEAAPASSVTTPAPETGTEKPIQEKPKPRTGEDRKAELHAEIQDLLKQRAELQGKTDTGVKKADPPPAAVTPPAAAAKPAASGSNAEAPKEPNLDDFATYAEYQKADRAYVRELVKFEAKQLLETHETERAAADANAAADKVWKDKVAAAKEDHADFAEVAFSKDTPITPVMDGFILDSEHGARILYELGLDGSAEGKRIAALPPFAAVKALAQIEATFETPVKKTVIPITTPVKKHTAAPPPATNLGGHNTEPPDAATAALAAGDYAAYEAKQNALDIKARRG